MTVFHVFVYSDGRSVLLICCVSAKQWRENTESRFLPKGQSRATSSGADVPAACLAEWKHSECSSTFLPCSFGRRSGLQWKETACRLCVDDITSRACACICTCAWGCACVRVGPLIPHSRSCTLLSSFCFSALLHGFFLHGSSFHLELNTNPFTTMIQNVCSFGRKTRRRQQIWAHPHSVPSRNRRCASASLIISWSAVPE